jgi:hypothetical protein
MIEWARGDRYGGEVEDTVGVRCERRISGDISGIDGKGVRVSDAGAEVRATRYRTSTRGDARRPICTGVARRYGRVEQISPVIGWRGDQEVGCNTVDLIRTRADAGIYVTCHVEDYKCVHR